MNYYDRHVGDTLKDTLGLSMLEDGAYNRLLDQQYTTERPLPVDKKEVYRLARATTAAERKAVDYVLGKFFAMVDGGYSHERAQAQIEEYWDREPAEQNKRENAKIRQQRSRERRKALFDALRGHGVTPPFNASMAHLESELSRVTACDIAALRNAPVTRDDTLTQYPVPNTHIPESKIQADDDSTVSGGASSSSEDKIDLQPGAGAPLPALEPAEPPTDPAVLIAVELRKLRVNANSMHPTVISWAVQGVKLSMLTEAVAIARESKPAGNIPPNYLIPIVNDLLNPPAAPATVSASRPPRPPRKPDGMDPKGIDESYHDYEARISAAEAARRKGAAP